MGDYTMKKLISLILTAIFAVPALIFTAIPSFAAGENDDAQDITIVIPSNANTYEKAAAEFLRDTVRESTGAEYAIVTDSQAKGSFEISVGATNRVYADLAALADGSYFIKSYNGGVAVIGAGTRGNIYGVCRLLKDFGNYHSFVAGDKLTNDGSALSFTDNIDIEYTPFFEYTETDWRLRQFDSSIYSVANGLNGGVYSTIPDSLGGTVNYIGSFCHTLTAMFCSKDKYFASHPEYFALRNGERTPDQLCLTNDDVYNTVLGEVMDILREKHDPTAALQIISLTQADNQNYCECESCKKLDEENGSHSGTMITFANRIAEQVALAGYSNIAIDTFAYQYTRKPPKNVKPLDNVIVRLCSIECCFSHTFDDPSCERNANFMSDLSGWGKICNRIYIWDYATNYARTLCVFPNFGVLQKNMQILYENSAKGVYVEGNYYLKDSDGEFGDLRSYLISCLLTDPYCDYEKEMRDFCNSYYGAAGEQIVEFISMTSENAAKNHLGIYNDIAPTLSFTKSEINKCNELWETAKLNTADDETAASHVRRSEISWRMWKSAVRKSEFALFGLFPERMRLYRDIYNNFGITKYFEWGKSMMLPLSTILGTPNYWNHAKGEAPTDYSGFMDFCIKIHDFFLKIFKR